MFTPLNTTAYLPPSVTDGSVSFSPRRLVTFVNSNAARELQAALEWVLGDPVDVVVTDNTRRMITSQKQKDRWELRIHHMFVGCSNETFESLVRFVRRDDEGRVAINQYIKDNDAAIRRRPLPEGTTEGDVHDLDAYRDRVLEMLSRDDLNDIKIMWGRAGTGTRSIRFGSYDFGQRLIRIHPKLDQSWVPDYFVEFVVYHEYLHAVVPPTRNKKRYNYHPPEFKQLEAQYPYFQEAIAWENANLDKILR